MIDLAAIRRAAGVTQVQLAERLGVGQAQVSKTEHRSDLLLSTLIAYLQALGVDATLTVVVPGAGTIHHSLTDAREGDQ